MYGIALQQDYNNHALHCNLSMAYLHAKEYHNSLEAAENCIKIKPDFVNGYYRKGVALHGLGRYDEAILTY